MRVEKIIRVFPRKTKWTPDDDLTFIGDVPLFRPVKDLPVRISCTFTWDIEESERLKRAWSRFYSDVQVGGPAYDDRGGEFEPGLFIKSGAIHTSRGCTKNCDWCLVPEREGSLREYSVNDGWNICDNNILACSKEHIRTVFEMLMKQKKPAKFSGGLDPEIFNDDHAAMLKSIRLNEAWFACDYYGAIKSLEKVADKLHGFPTWKKRCYVLIGYNGETITMAEKRLRVVYGMGFLPFAQLYRPKTAIKKNHFWPDEWLKFQKYWSRPAIYRSQENKDAS
ncbi:hypothetical protein KAR91_47050 [Candidatus Pacearchaeota archaeon]|nr:hypothetical protein [Candidatus Pacearchaeota archaeon]